jgi:hypothetical protein
MDSKKELERKLKSKDEIIERLRETINLQIVELDSQRHHINFLEKHLTKK